MNIDKKIGEVALKDLNYKTKYMLVLYKYPLYQKVDDNETIRIAVCANVDQEVEDGGENFKKACEFVDTCLQIAPMDNHSLEFHFITDNPEVAWEKISESRPALGYFLQVKVEGERKDELNDDDSKHGYKDIIIIRKEKDEKEIRENWMKKPDIGNKKYYAYAFMEEENPEIDGCSKTTMTLGNEDKWFEQGNEKTDVKDLYAEIVKMAFNVYMSYSNSINDRNNKWKSFYDSEYDRLSSMANAVSIKYKLKSIGVNWDEENRQKVADCFRKKIEARDGNSVIEKLAALEHRRWIFERVAEGYTAPLKVKEGTNEYELDYDKIINQIAKTGKALCKGEEEEEEKWHACLLKSWVSEPPGEKDELDDMSETLANKLNEKAGDIRQLKIFDGAPLQRAHKIGERAKKVFGKQQATLRGNQEWEEYRYCVNSIFDGNNYYYEKYESCKKKLEKTGLLPECIEYNGGPISPNDWATDMKQVIELVNAANCRRDYKQTDRDLAKMIPFILTYRTDLHLIMPFENVGGFSDRTERMFKNVASATLLNPEKITYLFNMDNNTNLDVLIDNIKCTVAYLKKSDLLDGDDGIHVTFALINELDSERMEKLKKEMSGIVCVVEASEMEEVPSTSEDYICFDVTCALYSTVKENVKFITELKNRSDSQDNLVKKIKGVISVFETNIKEREIMIVDGDTSISNNDIKPHIMINGLMELWGLNQKLENSWNYINEYEELWKVYQQNPDAWRRRCGETVEVSKEKKAQLEEKLKSLNVIDDSGNYTSAVYEGLFKQTGNMLEIYIYHRMITLGNFDDFALSLELKKEEFLFNEFDGIFVKGFSTYIVECKSGKIGDKKDDILYKLGAIGAYYGISNRNILVTKEMLPKKYELRKKQLNIESYTPKTLAMSLKGGRI